MKQLVASRPNRLAARFSTFALLLAVGMAAGSAGASSIAQVEERGRLIVLSSPHAASSFMHRTPAGGFEGFDYDIMKTFSASLGVELEVRAVDEFDDLIPALLRGDGDVIASSFSITPERQKRVDYSKPYFPVVVMVVVRKGSSIRTPEDLTGAVGSTVPGSSLEERMKALGGLRFHHVPQSYLNYEAVEAGDADFTFVDSTSALTVLPRYERLEVAFSFPDVEHYGFAVRPGSDLRQALDSHLDDLRRGGVFYNIVRRTFGQKGLELFQVGEGKQ